MLAYLEFVTKLQFQKLLVQLMFLLFFQFLVGSIHYPIDNELVQIIQLVLLLNHTTLFLMLQKPQRKLLKYYLKELFQYFPFVKHDINVEEVLLLNGKYQQ
mmetsp:Transcript_3293/g.5523  ORF Transcript_3293/g.5523 Transcript_3293/m.5523 type:complete len:101 (-) Transcript_3293:654-956(-)